MVKIKSLNINNSIRFSKNGQFFILAAVILAAVIISLGSVTNYVRVNKEPENFYDFSYDVRKESGVVLDHQIYSGFEDDANLTEFVDLMGADIRDKDPDANFIFIYGNQSNMTLRNYGGDDVTSGDTTVEGGGTSTISQITQCFDTTCYSIDTSQPLSAFSGDWVETVDLGDADSIGVEVEGEEYSFPVSKHKQVIFIMQKDVDDETFVTVER